MRGKFYRMKQAVTKNHFQLALSTTGGTELQTPVATGIDAPNDRGIDVPENSVLRSVVCNMSALATVTGKHQCMLWRRPGGSTNNGIASFWLTTDPATEEMIEIRRSMMSTVHTKHIIIGAVEPLKFSCHWRGNMRMYDGDDVILSLLDGTSTDYDVQVWLTFTR